MLYPGEGVPSTQWTGGSVASEPVSTIHRSENSWSYRDSNCGPSVAQLVGSGYTDYDTVANNNNKKKKKKNVDEDDNNYME
jgi:hypothetical protein